MITIGGYEINLLTIGIIGAIILAFAQYKLLRSKKTMAVKLIPVYVVAFGFLCCGLLALGVFGDFTAQGYAGNVNAILAKGFAITFIVMSVGLLMGFLLVRIKVASESVDMNTVMAMAKSKNNKTLGEYEEEYEEYDEEEYDYDDDDYEYDEDYDEEYEYDEDDEYEYEDEAADDEETDDEEAYDDADDESVEKSKENADKE